ncbi:hypothetical protein CPBF367_38940 [Xanthomonas arboricola pv. juglandis]|nr:hypothetical protein CPBF367_38940 [Xanthomonas arboricola pv. juglandis]
MVAGRGAAAAARVLARAPERCAGAARAAHRPAAPSGAELCRRTCRSGSATGACEAVAVLLPTPRHHRVHDPAQRLGAVDVAPERAGRGGDRDTGGEPAARRDRAADRLLRQHPGPAGERAGRVGRGRAAGPGQGDRAGRLRPSGRAVRAGGRYPATLPQLEPRSAVPDHFRAQQHPVVRRFSVAGHHLRQDCHTGIACRG